MEYVEGLDLSRIKPGSSISLGRQLAIALDASRGLLYAHGQGVLHRDIKPGNILVSALDGNAKITDFGIATSLSGPDTALTQTGEFLGTPAYISPEQLRGEQVDFRADIFSLGVTLYEFLTGISPFTGSSLPETVYRIIHGGVEPPRSFRKDIPLKLEKLIVSMMEVQPRDRPTSMDEVVSVLQDVVSLLYVSPWVGLTLGSDTGTPGDTATLADTVVETSPVTRLGRLPAPTGFFARTTLRQTAFFSNDEARYTKIEETVQFYRDHLNDEYQAIMAQARQTYILWVVCVIIGLMMLVAGTISMLAGYVSNGVAAAAASIVTYFIQKIFQQREDHFRKLAKRKNAHLEYGNYWLLAIQSVDAIEDPEQRVRQQSRLADVLSEQLMRSPATKKRDHMQGEAPNSGPKRTPDGAA